MASARMREAGKPLSARMNRGGAPLASEPSGDPTEEHTEIELASTVHVERARRAAEARKRSTKRRNIDPTTCEIDYQADEVEFMMAMQRYKEQNRRPFPTWKEILEVLKTLGYRKVADEGAQERQAG